MTSYRYENIDEASGKFRFYTIQVQPDLFGRWSLIREWGRIGSKGGQVNILPFETEKEAMCNAESHKQKRLSRGYEPVSN